MNSSLGRSGALAGAALFSFALAAAGGGVRPLTANSAGPLPGYSGAPGDSDCTACHTTNPVNSGSATPTITAPSVVTPGSAHVVGVSITGNQNPAKNGFEITLRDAAGSFVGSWTTLMLPPLFNAAKTQTHPFNAGYHEHSASGNTLSAWTMQWNAPTTLAPGPVTLYAAVNDADGDASASGDFIYVLSKKMFQASLTSPSSTWGLGALASLVFSAPGRAGDYYFIAPSEDPTPFPLGGAMELQVNPLTGFTAYALSTPTFFINLTGVLGSTDSATGYVYVPPLPALSGLSLHFAGVTTNATAVPTEVSNRFTALFQ